MKRKSTCANFRSLIWQEKMFQYNWTVYSWKTSLLGKMCWHTRRRCTIRLFVNLWIYCSNGPECTISHCIIHGQALAVKRPQTHWKRIWTLLRNSKFYNMRMEINNVQCALWRNGSSYTELLLFKCSNVITKQSVRAFTQHSVVPYWTLTVSSVWHCVAPRVSVPSWYFYKRRVN